MVSGVVAPHHETEGETCRKESLSLRTPPLHPLRRLSRWGLRWPLRWPLRWVSRWVLRWLLPLLLLGLLLRLVDLGQLQQLLLQAHWPMVALGLALSVCVVGLAAARWWVLAHSQPDLQLSWLSAFADYWRSLAVGLMAPGSIGSDLYRVFSLGRCSQRYLHAASLLLVDKAAALLACVLILVVLPWGTAGPALGQTLSHLLPTDMHSNFSASRAMVLSLLLVLAGTGAAAAWRWRHGLKRRLHHLCLKLERRCRRAARRANLVVASPLPAKGQVKLSAGSPHLSGLRLLLTLLLSLGVFAASALQAHVFFAALGHPVPMAANLLVAPLLFVVLSLPVSVGGLGVREVAFVSLYSLFAVPAEVALLVSTLALVGFLANCAVGALLWASRRHPV